MTDDNKRSPRRFSLIGMSHVKLKKDEVLGYTLEVFGFGQLTKKEAELFKKDLVYKYNHCKGVHPFDR